MECRADIKLWNDFYHESIKKGFLPKEKMKVIEKKDVLVDTGATYLVIPKIVAEELELEPRGERRVSYADGRLVSSPLTFVGVEILRRESVLPAVIQENGKDVLIGHIVLEALDLHIDLEKSILIPNPKSPDMPSCKIYTQTKSTFFFKKESGKEKITHIT